MEEEGQNRGTLEESTRFERRGGEKTRDYHARERDARFGAASNVDEERDSGSKTRRRIRVSRWTETAYISAVKTEKGASWDETEKEQKDETVGERERRGPNGRLGRSGQLKKDEEIGLCRRRRDSTERAGVPQTGRRLSGMRDPSPRLPSPGRSPRRPSTPLPPTTTDPRGFPSFSTLRAPTDNTPLHHYQSRHTIETANC